MINAFYKKYQKHFDVSENNFASFRDVELRRHLHRLCDWAGGDCVPPCTGMGNGISHRAPDAALAAALRRSAAKMYHVPLPVLSAYKICMSAFLQFLWIIHIRGKYRIAWIFLVWSPDGTGSCHGRHMLVTGSPFCHQQI